MVTQKTICNSSTIIKCAVMLKNKIPEPKPQITARARCSTGTIVCVNVFICDLNRMKLLKLFVFCNNFVLFTLTHKLSFVNGHYPINPIQIIF